MLNLSTICRDVAAACEPANFSSQLSRAWDTKGLPPAATPEATKAPAHKADLNLTNG